MSSLELKILAMLDQGEVSARDLLKVLLSQGDQISQPSLSRVLKKLGEEGEIERLGRGKSTKYIRTSIQKYFSEPPTRRPTKPYNFNFLKNFDPTSTSIFTKDEARELYAAGCLSPQPLSTSVRLVYKRFMIDLCWASSALEGNTYSYLDTEVLITYGQPAEGKSSEETQMILNHKDAIQYILNDLQKLEINLRTIKDIHALLSRDLIAKEYVGTIRTRSVGIGGSTYRPIDVPTILTEEVGVMLTKLGQIRDPFDQSIFCLALLAYLQLFDDVNKRTSRLVANIPLLKNNLCPLSFVDVDKRAYTLGILSFYELQRFQELRKCFSDGYLKSAKLLKTTLLEMQT